MFCRWVFNGVDYMGASNMTDRLQAMKDAVIDGDAGLMFHAEGELLDVAKGGDSVGSIFKGQIQFDEHAILNKAELLAIARRMKD